MLIESDFLIDAIIDILFEGNWSLYFKAVSMQEMIEQKMYSREEIKLGIKEKIIKRLFDKNFLKLKINSKELKKWIYENREICDDYEGGDHIRTLDLLDYIKQLEDNN